MKIEVNSMNTNKLMRKITRFAKKAGATVIYSVLILYYTFQKPDLSKKTKTTILGSIAYFILPFDFIPDLLIGIGFTDDLFVLAYGISQVIAHIDTDVKTKAKEKLNTWFSYKIDTSIMDKKLKI